MSRYRVRADAEEIKFFVRQSPVSIALSSQAGSDGIVEESITIQAPTWNQIAVLHTMASGGGMLPFAPDKELDKLLIKYFLVSASFFEVDRQTEEEGQKYVANVVDLLSEVHPALIDYIVLCIRQRM